MDDISSVLVFIDAHHKQCVNALQAIALLSDTGSKEYKERFEGTVTGDNGWRVAETMREIALSAMGNVTKTTTYTVKVLASLQSQCMLELLALPVEIRSKSQADGFTTIAIKCDAATAAKIAERYHISEV